MATKVFVAAMVRSGPAPTGSTNSHAAASGDAVSFVTATVRAPAPLACDANAMRSSLLPDCEMARTSLPLRRRFRWYTLAMLGAASATGNPT